MAYASDKQAAKKASGRTAKKATSDGAFYTGLAGALMLSGLANPPQMGDWSDWGYVMSIRIWEPSCGSGTLLIAALEQVVHNCRKAGWEEDDISDLRVYFVEERIVGWDIDEGAVNECRERLRSWAPGSSAEKISNRIAHLPHGPRPDGSVKLGALDVLREISFNGDEFVDRLFAEPGTTADA